MYLFQQFNKDFHIVLEYVDSENKGMLNYQMVSDILIMLGFMRKAAIDDSSYQVKQERLLLFDLWRMLRGDETCRTSVRNLKLMLVGVLDLKFNWMIPEPNEERLLSI